MSRKMLIFLTACILCLGIVSATLVGIQAAPENPNAGFSLPWWTINSGGGTSQGGAYSIRGTIGQADVGRLSGGSYVLEGGFWSGAIQTPPPTPTDTPTPTDIPAPTATTTPAADYTTFLPVIIH